MLFVGALPGCWLNGPSRVPAPQFTSAAVPLTAGRRIGSTSAEGAQRRGTSNDPAGIPVVSLPRATARAWKYIVVHHSATAGGSVASIDAAHRQRRDAAGNRWLGIGYHFVIGNGNGMPDGQVQPTFRWRDQIHGAHAGSRDHNQLGIGICLIGNFDQQPPTRKQRSAARQLIQQLRQQYEIAAEGVLPHHAVSATRCPGERLTVKTLVASPSGGAPVPAE